MIFLPWNCFMLRLNFIRLFISVNPFEEDGLQFRTSFDGQRIEPRAVPWHGCPQELEASVNGRNRHPQRPVCTGMTFTPILVIP